jgi:hypothetical protein
VGTQAASIWRPISGRVKVQVPARDASLFRRWMLQEKITYESVGEGVHWVPRSRGKDVLRALTWVYPQVRELRDSRVSSRVVCTAACQDAKGEDCVCICGGLNHRGEGDLREGVNLGEVQVLWTRGTIRRVERVYTHTP